MYTKVCKWISWVLLLAGVAVSIYGFVVGFETNEGTPVDTLLYWTYAMVGLALAAIILVGLYVNATINPKSLLKIVLVLVGAAAIVAIAYVLAPGTPAIGYLGEPVSDGTLKFTDTILNLTYFAFFAAVASILGGSIIAAVRK